MNDPVDPVDTPEPHVVLLNQPGAATAGADARVRDALVELVALKDIKDRADKLAGGDGWMDPTFDAEALDKQVLLAEYNYRKPLAWAAARAALSQSQGRVIPREPTEAMVRAGKEAWNEHNDNRCIAPQHTDCVAIVYRAMYDAAPVVDPPLPADERYTRAGLEKSAAELRAQVQEDAAMFRRTTTGDERRDSPDPTDGAATSNDAATTRRNER